LRNRTHGFEDAMSRCAAPLAEQRCALNEQIRDRTGEQVGIVGRGEEMEIV
jgi:hypothetical protein